MDDSTTKQTYDHFRAPIYGKSGFSFGKNTQSLVVSRQEHENRAWRMQVPPHLNHPVLCRHSLDHSDSCSPWVLH